MIRRLLKNLNILNLLLLGLLIYLARFLLYPVPEPEIKVNPSSQQKAGIEEMKKDSDGATSSPADYMVIAEQNPFHPERKIPVEKKAEQPLPKPEFVLYGTLITDDLSLAYMEDKKAPVSTPGRGNRQVSLKIGDSLSGFKLKEIEPEKVVMVRGEETMTVMLQDPRKVRAIEANKQQTPSPEAQKQSADKQKENKQVQPSVRQFAPQRDIIKKPKNKERRNVQEQVPPLL
jgi:hypothetical protein